ncbi:protein ASPARTIC PROTEASE IN GUARD CELL 1-like [Musa acuminata AAA Group]|uniref:protein ASPARTIC PROTEASE IN GUARD CELL 1-like n=1 Tax=Musa acuminata AAA Group TaxID=214697 RepID=UPI0031CF900E
MMVAENTHSRLFLLFLFSLLTLSTSPAMSLHPEVQSTGYPTTATLDVSTSLAQAHLALSYRPPSSTELPSHLLPYDPSSAISVALHSRDFLPSFVGSSAHGHPDYKALTLARLFRDVARVRSIAVRATLAFGAVADSVLNPNTDVKALQIAAVNSIMGSVISGASMGSGEYFSRVGVGSPPKPLYMILDTGSDVSWVQCLPCADCYEQSDPVFDPSDSSSYTLLSCDSSLCHSLALSACRNSTYSSSGPAAAADERCLYQVMYGDGSYTVGDFATETLTFGGSASVSEVAMGCGHDNEGVFDSAAGLLGLGGGPLSFPTQISARSITYCLVDRDSNASSILNISTAASTPSSTLTAPLLRNPLLDTFYYVELTGISVGGKMLPIPPSAFAIDESTGAGGVIVDSGTSVTRLQEAAYATLRDDFQAQMDALPPAERMIPFDTCYNLSSRASVTVPSVAFHFPEGKALLLPAKNYLIPVNDEGTYCLAFAPSPVAFSIIGNVQQQGTRVIFDLVNDRVGFTPDMC